MSLLSRWEIRIGSIASRDSDHQRQSPPPVPTSGPPPLVLVHVVVDFWYHCPNRLESGLGTTSLGIPKSLMSLLMTLNNVPTDSSDKD